MRLSVARENRHSPLLSASARLLKWDFHSFRDEGIDKAMSVTAIGFRDTRAARFWNAVNGKKAVMAVTGVVLFLFVIVHMLGNLQIFLGRGPFNHYAELLRVEPVFLWIARLVLLVSVALHIWASLRLMQLNKLTARPVGYVKKTSVGSSYASRTMYWSGPIIAAFVIYHLMQFTWGVGGTDYDPADAYGNVVRGFQVAPIAIAYIVAMGLLLLHLYHGAWSMFQTLGFNHPRYTPLLKRFAQIVSIALFIGFSSIPLSIVTGLVQ
jgi:succinate dehydrogenase / fumarate reductase cytochrome b subunit